MSRRFSKVTGTAHQVIAGTSAQPKRLLTHLSLVHSSQIVIGSLAMYRAILVTTAAALLSVITLVLPVAAETMTFTADLKAASEVPPVDSVAAGSAELVVDTDAKKVSWTVTVKDLSGDATAAHIHGPADAGQNAGPMVDLSAAIMKGSADISDAQIADLQSGKTYVNVHTAKFPDGEIRGQLKK